MRTNLKCVGVGVVFDGDLRNEWIRLLVELKRRFRSRGCMCVLLSKYSGFSVKDNF